MNKHIYGCLGLDSGLCARFSLVDPNKVKACKSFAFTQKFPIVEIKVKNKITQVFFILYTQIIFPEGNNNSPFILKNKNSINTNENSPKNSKRADCYSIYALILASSSSNSISIHKFYDSTAIRLGYQRFWKLPRQQTSSWDPDSPEFG